MDVLSRKSVGFLVSDLTGNAIDANGGFAQAAAVSGAKVVLTSLYTNTSVEAVSDERGKAIFADISALAIANNDDKPPTYHFWGSIEVTKDGYRTFKTGRILVKGARFFVAATQPHDGKSSYLRACTYEGFDMQYFPCTMPSTRAIPDKHTVRCEVVAPNAKQVKVELFNKGWFMEGVTGKASVKDGVAVVDIPYAYCADTDMAGYATYLTVYLDGRKSYRVNTRLAFKTAPIDKPTEGKAGVVPGENGASKNGSDAGDGTDPGENVLGGPLTLTLPNSIPLVGGLEFDPGVGSLPISYHFDPWGMSWFGLNVAVAYETVNGEKVEGTWKTYNNETMAEHRANMQSDFDAAVKRYDACKRHKKDKNSWLGTSDKLKTASIGMSFQALAVGGYDWKTNDKSWEMGPQFTVSFWFSKEVTKQLMLGPAPVFIGFGIGINANAQLAFLTRMKGLDFSTMTWSGKSSEPLTVNVDIGMSVTAGIGVKDIVSVGATGRAGVDTTFTVHTLDKPQPHIVLTAYAAVTVTGQFLFYKVTHTVYDNRWDDPPILDNWKGKLEPGDFDAAAAPAGLEPATLGYGLPEANSSWNIVTEGELAKTAEFNGATTAQGSAEFSYDAESWTGASVDGFGISGMSELGAEPLVEQLVFKNVLSDPRVKIIPCWKTQLMLRLASVKLDGGAVRTRVTVSHLDGTVWSKPEVLDFQIVIGYDTPSGQGDQPAASAFIGGADDALSEDARAFKQGVEEAGLALVDEGFSDVSDNPPARKDLFDVDFDIVPFSDGFALVVISSLRPNGDNTPIADAGLTNMVTIVDYTLQQSGGKYLYHRNTQRSFLPKPIEGHAPCLTKPQISAGDKKGMATFEARCGSGSNPTVFSNERYIGAILFEKKAGLELERALIKRKDGTPWSTISTPTHLESHSFSVPYAGQFKSEGRYRLEAAASLRYASTVVDIAQDHEVDITWLDFSTFMYTDAGKLRLATFGNDGKLSVQDVSIERFDHESFGASADGKHLFWTQVEEGEGRPKYDAQGTVQPRSGDPVKTFQIMAAKRYGNVFTPPFPLAKLKNRADGIVGTSGTKGSLAFLYTNFRDVANSTSDLWFTSIPWVQSVQLAGCACDNPFVAAGEPAPLSVRVINTGSTCVDGVTVSIYDNAEKSGSPVDTVTIDFTRDTMQTTINMMETGFESDGAPTYADEEGFVTGDAFNVNGVLLPGQDRVYSASMNVPADWKTEQRTLHAFLESARTTVEGPFAEVVPEGVEIIDHLDNAAAAAFAFDPTATLDFFGPNNYEILGDDPVDPVKPDDPAKPKPPTKTGDPLGLGVLGVAGLAAAAGLGAYSARRAANEDARKGKRGED